MKTLRLIRLGAIAALLAITPSIAAVDSAQATVIRDLIKAKAPKLSGNVLVEQDGQLLFQESYGLANRQFAVPNANDTRFRIASVTKLFTAVIALQLHGEGKLALDVPIAKWLADCGDAIGTNVTVHQLLNHTSGLADVAAIKSKEDAIRNGMEIYQRPHTTAEIAARYCGAPPTNPAGKAFNYNNGDYILLGRIIEKVEGQPFETVLQRRILQPLAMQSSGMLEQHRVVPKLASGYFHRDAPTGELSNDMPKYDENWFAAGAMVSSAGDLQKFATALFEGRLLPAPALALLLKPGLDSYGYGVWIYEDTIGGRKYTSVMRPGQIMGTNVVLYRVVEPKLTIVILSNTDDSNVDALAFELTKALLK